MRSIFWFLLMASGGDVVGVVPKHMKFIHKSKHGLIKPATVGSLRLGARSGEVKKGDLLVLRSQEVGRNERFEVHAEEQRIQAAGNPALCLNTKGGAREGNPIVLWTCHTVNDAVTHDRFVFGEDGRIRLAGDQNLCVNVKEGIREGAALILYRCGNVVPNANDVFIHLQQDLTIRVKYDTAYRFYIAGGELKPNAPVVVRKQRPPDHEMFDFIGDRLRLRQHRNFCAQAEGGLDAGHNIVLWPCHTPPQPHERFKHDAETNAIVSVVDPSLGFNVKGAVMQVGTEIILWHIHHTEL